MIPLKENLVFFEVLERIQVRIWPDSCDMGVWLTDNNRQRIWKKLFELTDFYPHDVWRCEAGDQWGVVIKIPFEYDGPEHYQGCLLSLSIYHDPRTKKAFMSINTAAHRWEKTDD